MSVDWVRVAHRLESWASEPGTWRYGQESSLRLLAKRLRSEPGHLVADDVGLGKTRVALALVAAVLEHGGSAAVVVPPGLMFQWEREWCAFAPLEDRNSEPLLLRTYRDLFLLHGDGAPDWPLLRRRRHRWGIVSHLFGPSQLRNNSRPWRYGLPALAKALHRDQDAERGFRNGRLWRFCRESFGITGRPVRCEWDWPGAAAFASAANRLRDDDRLVRLLETVDDDDLIEPAPAKRLFQETDLGRRIDEHCLRRLLGPIDLLIIDEAHKNRDGGDGTTRLGRLLEHVLRPRSGGFRLALTATPIELRAEQWLDTLHRIGVGELPVETIRRFTEAHEHANRHPDLPDAIEELIATSGRFRDALRPLVSRRRRVEQREMRELLGAAVTAAAHPHRRIDRLAVPYASIQPNWRPIVLALEGLGLAAKGSGSAGAAARTADIRYASGQLGADLDDEEDNGAERLDEIGDPTGKRRRMAYWKRVANSHLGGDPESGLPSHPRIAATADRIEQILFGSGGEREKVLLFGVFLKPLRALQEVLNLRGALRLLDDGLPLPGDRETRLPPGALLAQYHANGSGVAPRYRGRLADLADPARDLPELEATATIRYVNVREQLARRIDGDFLRRLPGDAAIGQMSTGRERLLQLLRTRVLNEWLTGHGRPSGLSFERELSAEQLATAERRAREIWVEYLLSHLEIGEVDGEVEEVTSWQDEGPIGNRGVDELARLDRLGDNLDPRAIARLVEDEAETGMTRFSAFARLLSGQVRMETRRVLQHQFNTPGGYPRVLLSQSQVGREGLNLHTACRHVILFHTEWNPAVIEQQIGRVDRIRSRWEELAENWRAADGDPECMPRIEVEHVVFEGTYDEYQWSVYERRHRNLMAHLHGELLGPEQLERVPEGCRERLAGAAPDFSPTSAGRVPRQPSPPP